MVLLGRELVTAVAADQTTYWLIDSATDMNLAEAITLCHLIERTHAIVIILLLMIPETLTAAVAVAVPLDVLRIEPSHQQIRQISETSIQKLLYITINGSNDCFSTGWIHTEVAKGLLIRLEGDVTIDHL